MEQLITSRLEQKESPLRLGNLSPEKFGKGAYAQLSYTPSKLASNVLYKEASHMKRVEEGSSRIRESEATNGLLREKLKHTLAEKEGVEKALTMQIAMYKQIIAEMEGSHEGRIRELQGHFGEEMQRVIEGKEEEAKYVQSEKEMLENRIVELESIVGEAREEQLATQQEREKLQQLYEIAKEEISVGRLQREELEGLIERNREMHQEESVGMSSKVQEMQTEHLSELEQQAGRHALEVQQLEAVHRAALESAEMQRQQDLDAKDKQLKEIATSLTAQKEGARARINILEQLNEEATRRLQEEKAKGEGLAQQHSVSLAQLAREKNSLINQAETLRTEMFALREKGRRVEEAAGQKAVGLGMQVEQLREELELSHLNYVREKENHALTAKDMHSEIVILRKNAEKTGYVGEENAVLVQEMRKLRELLTESSREMERCKEELLRMGREKEQLVGKLGELDMENEALYRVKLELEQEARNWRETYYKSR